MGSGVPNKPLTILGYFSPQKVTSIFRLFEITSTMPCKTRAGLVLDLKAILTFRLSAKNILKGFLVFFKPSPWPENCTF